MRVENRDTFRLTRCVPTVVIVVEEGPVAAAVGYQVSTSTDSLKPSHPTLPIFTPTIVEVWITADQIILPWSWSQCVSRPLPVRRFGLLKDNGDVGG